jgi:histidinol-phosphate aminotransferase
MLASPTLLPCTVAPKRLVQTMATYSPPLDGRRGALRLDFNENTEGFPTLYPGALSPELFTVYPEYTALTQELAKLYNLLPEQILLCNGSDEALFVIPATFIEPNEDVALYCNPTFPMIIHNLQLSGGKLKEITLNADLSYPLETIEAALQETPVKMAIFASPDNPTGAILPKATLEGWCKRFPQTLFVLDEAYSEYMGAEFSALPLVAQYPNLMVTRSFSKAWGLAGLRLGFVAAHPQLVAYMTRVRSPYSVNQMAVESALALLPNAEQVFSSAVAAKQRRDALIETLRGKGYKVHAAGGNFFLLHLGLAAKPLEQFLAKRRILVRDRSAHPMLKGTVRISTGTEPENQRFLEALTEFEKTTALIFDLDDTLVDTSQSFDVAVAFVVRKFSPFPLGQNELTLLRQEGGYNDDWVAAGELLKRRGVEMSYEAIQKEGQRVYLQLAEEAETWLLEPEALQRLAKRYRCFVFTGRHLSEYEPVWKERLAPLMEAVICSDAVAGLQPKPSADYLLWMKAQFGLETFFYIGNSVDDMRSAVAAGGFALGVAHTQSETKLLEAGASVVLQTITPITEAFAL